ncbi:hypothetical protein CHS0354_003402 [Potamilus streckersoni]|uniref:Uncharacterized protein n=1 Tax=Potamilus streckersoni TaxID=2493646 RepID=A0AAE0VZY4_9BIVA|nr:hypothetical protein CHS0354_003402 [Potamilus streckersoni]
MQLYIAFFLIGVFVWKNCIATCPDGSVNDLICRRNIPFECPEGYSCFVQGDDGHCCLDRQYSDYTCAVGLPLGYGNPSGLTRCNGPRRNAQLCPRGFVCKAVEWTRTRIGICCPYIP